MAAVSITRDKQIIDQASARTLELLADVGCAPRRGPAGAFVDKLSRINWGMTLRPLIDADRHVWVVVLKNLYATWNFSLDDDVDDQRSAANVADSAAILARGAAVAKTPAGGVLAELLDRAPRLGRHADLGPLRVALGEIVASYHFEYASRASEALAEPDRWLRHATTICSRDPYLALDLLAADGALDAAAFRSLTPMMRDVAAAIALASTVGARSRDRFEGSRTIVDMWVRDERLSEADAIARARARARALVARARNAARAIRVPGLPKVLDTATGTVEGYLLSDLFELRDS